MASARRSRSVWLGLGLVLALLLCTVPVGLVVVLVDRAGRETPGPGDRSGRADRGPAPSPRAGDPVEATAAWVGDRMSELLSRQAEALLRGDEQGWLAVAGPEKAVLADLRRKFRVLRGMRVAAWKPKLRDDPTRGAGPRDEWWVAVQFRHCFVIPACESSVVEFGTRWIETAGQLRLVGWDQSGLGPPFAGASVAGEDEPAAEGPRPWELSDLVVAVGRRTLVATTPAFRSKLPGLREQAERAAAVADRYAVDGTPPDQYRIFYAGVAEWKRWYGGDFPSWTSGYAVAVGERTYDVVLNAGSVHPSLLGDLLRHEMTHAASLPGPNGIDSTVWWLVEGLAEHAAAAGRPVRRYDGLPDVRKLLDADGWNGRLADMEPAADAADWEVAGSYGLGYLAVQHLVDRFGERRLFDFVKAVVNDGQSAATAALEVLGEDWAALHDECVVYLRGQTS